MCALLVTSAPYPLLMNIALAIKESFQKSFLLPFSLTPTSGDEHSQIANLHDILLGGPVGANIIVNILRRLA